MQYDLWQLFSVCWDEMSLNHSAKKGSAPLVWPNPTMVHRSPSSPHVLHLALSPSCWFSSICLLWPSPEEASIKSPLRTTTGLDSYKLEQNNLFFPRHHTHPSPTPPCLSLSVPHRQRQELRALLWGREHFLFTDAHCIDVSCFHQATLLAATHSASLSLPAFYFLCLYMLIYLLRQGEVESFLCNDIIGCKSNNCSLMALIIYITCYLPSKEPFSAKSNLHAFLSLVMTLAEEKTAFPPVCGSGGSCKN